MASQPSAFEVTAFLATVASLVLSIVAIWLSVVFYRMSSQLSESTKEAAKGLGSSVERLEKLFDKLYADTFSMMRDTVSDMRKHIWPEGDTGAEHVAEEAEKKADEEVDHLRTAMEAELSNVLSRQRMTDGKVESLRAEMQSLIERAIAGSRRVELEARKDTVREHILRELLTARVRNRRAVRAEELAGRLPFPTGRVVAELERLSRENQVHLSAERIGPDTEVELTSAGIKASARVGSLVSEHSSSAGPSREDAT